MLLVLVTVTYGRILTTFNKINAVNGETHAIRGIPRRATRSLDEIFSSLEPYVYRADPYVYRPRIKRVYASADDDEHSNQNNFFYNPAYHNTNYYPHHKLFVPNLLG